MKRVILLCSAFTLITLSAWATTSYAADSKLPLHRGSHGKKVSALQWLIGNHEPNVFRHTKIKSTFPYKPNGLFGKRTAAGVRAYKWQLGYPKPQVNSVAGELFFNILLGKTKRPIRWFIIATKRASMPATGPSKRALAIKRIELSQLGVTEVPYGSNCGWLVYQYQRTTGAICAAWCVSFQQWAFNRSGFGTFANRSASVYYVVDWAHSRRYLRARPKIGALVAFIQYDRYGRRIPGTGHMGFVAKVTAGGFVSIEGNASNRVLERYHTNRERPHVFIYLPGVA